MVITFYKELNIKTIIEDVREFVRCSTGDVIITFNDNSEKTIKREDYTFFGVTK